MSITSAFGAATPIRNLIYQYDNLNNVTSRVDHVQNMTESFLYDRQDRLKQSWVSGQIGQTPYDRVVGYTYDANGNILNKSDVGAYTYGSQNRGSNNAGPHALVSAGSNHLNYQYDANGNLLQGGGRTLQWSSFNKPTLISKAGASNVLFRYGPDRARYLKATTSSRTLYLGKTYEQVETGSKVEHKHFIYADGQLVSIHVKTSDNGTAQPDQTRYLHRDALGSIDTITDGQGNVVERMSFEPFGERRAGDWRYGTGLATIPALTNRGFTGHEHVDEMGLIHMNGRVYDPTLGRFLSADPTMQFPYSSQGYNRYSYVQNNPLKYTDPSGYFLKKFFKKVFKGIKKLLKNKIVRMVAAIAVGYFTGLAVLKSIGYAGYSSAATFASLGASKAIGSLALAGAAGGFAGGLVASGGDLKSALIGGLTGGLAGFIGASPVFGSVGKVTVERVIAHGVVGGVSNELRGGKFIKGFLSSAFTKAVSDPIQALTSNNPVSGGIAAAVVGGTVSKLSGGRFANGAMTAAFQYLFNHTVATGKRLTLAIFGWKYTRTVYSTSLIETGERRSFLGESYERSTNPFEFSLSHVEEQTTAMSFEQYQGKSYSISGSIGGLAIPVSVGYGHFRGAGYTGHEMEYQVGFDMMPVSVSSGVNTVIPIYMDYTLPLSP